MAIIPHTTITMDNLPKAIVGLRSTTLINLSLPLFFLWISPRITSLGRNQQRIVRTNAVNREEHEASKLFVQPAAQLLSTTPYL